MKLLEIGSDQPLVGQADQNWSLRCTQNMVVHPGTTQHVRVSWPMLANEDFVELSEQGMLWEFYGAESDVQGGLDETCAQLVGGIASLRVGQWAKACHNVLFCNPKTLQNFDHSGGGCHYPRLIGRPG